MRSSIVLLLIGASVFSVTSAAAEQTVVTTIDRPRDAPPSRPSIEDRGHVIFDRILSYGIVPGGGVAFGGIVGYSSASSDGTMQGPLGATGQPQPNVSSRSTYTWFAPSADYVFSQRLTIGASIAVSNAHTRMTSDDGSGVENNAFFVSVVPRIGYIRALTDDLSIWTRVGFGGSESLTGSSTGAAGWELDADSALVIRAGRYFMANVGPTVRYATLRIREPGYANVTDGTASQFAIGGRFGVGLVF
jgi:hypothetical protein